jgi:signal transduction histidine kinase/ActR/RegA family two-component response regulator
VLTQAQRLLVSLIEPGSRARQARALATALGARDLIVFIEDEEVGAMLPAPGFAQTLQDGRRWRAFLQDAREAGRPRASFRIAGHEEPLEALGVAAADGSVLALLGGAPAMEEAEGVIALLPLLTQSLRSEQASIVAAGQALTARTAATQAHALAEKLTATREELHAALAAAEAAGRAKDDFLAVVSHELRTPLNAILGWSQLILMGRLDAKTQQKALHSIERNARSQSKLIADILDISRIVAGRFRLNVDAVDLASAIEAALDVVRPAAEAKHVRLHALLDSQLAPISGDAERLQQVFWNLLSNAVTYTPTGGRIDVRLRRVNSHVEVTVSDTGRGIDAGFLPHVFDRFRQEENSATRRHTGLGLGLAITRHLVELHGGNISAASEGAGRGATFTVALPLSAVQQSGEAAARPKLSAEEHTERRQLASLEGVRVLVVDDEPDVRELLSTLLRQSGAAVTAVRSAGEALETLGAMAPDIVVSDIEMPGEDGYSLMRKIRGGTAPSRSVPAIALSAYAGPGDRMRAFDAGFQLHVAKPVEPAELVAVISNLVNR